MKPLKPDSSRDLAAVEIEIRAAKPRDLPEILSLWRELQQTSAGFEPRLTPNAEAADWFADFLRGQMENDSARIFVAVSDDSVRGYIFGQIMRRPTLQSGDCGYIADLCVRAESRGQGVGRRLYLHLRHWFLERGVNAIEAQVVRANPASQAFWRKMGFEDFLRTLRREI